MELLIDEIHIPAGEEPSSNGVVESVAAVVVREY